MLEGPPGCWLYLFPTFGEVFLGPGASGLTDTFPFPPLEGRVGGLICAGEVTGAFSTDRRFGRCSDSCSVPSMAWSSRSKDSG